MAMLVLQVCARHYTADKHEDVKKVNELIRAMNDEYSQHWYDLAHSQAAAELRMNARVASWVVCIRASAHESIHVSMFRDFCC
jgi:hypothetical protein